VIFLIFQATANVVGFHLATDSLADLFNFQSCCYLTHFGAFPCKRCLFCWWEAHIMERYYIPALGIACHGDIYTQTFLSYGI